MKTDIVGGPKGIGKEAICKMLEDYHGEIENEILDLIWDGVLD